MVSHPLLEGAFTFPKLGKALSLVVAQSSGKHSSHLWIFILEGSGIIVLSLKTPCVSPTSLY